MSQRTKKSTDDEINSFGSNVYRSRDEGVVAGRASSGFILLDLTKECSSSGVRMRTPRGRGTEPIGT